MGTIMQSLQVVILLLTMVAAFNTKFLLVETEKSGKDIAGVDKAGFAGYEVGQDYYDQDYNQAYQTWGDGVTAYNGECRVGSQRAATAPTGYPHQPTDCSSLHRSLQATFWVPRM